MMSKPNNLCTRSVEFRATTEDSTTSDGRTMEGYAAVFDAPTDINSWEGRFTETVSRGAFKKTLGERKPVLQFDHGHDSRVGSTPIGHFTELREDDNGLYCQARLFDNPIVEPVRQAIEAGAVSGMSFRFKVNRDEWRDNADKLVKPEELGRLLYEPGDRGPLKRNIKEVQLFEAGPVVFPAYEQTTVGVRSLSDEEREQLVADYARTMADDDDRSMSLGGDGSTGGDAVPVKAGGKDESPAPKKKPVKQLHPFEDGNCMSCGY
jgi:HK97 family phage prohead protease